MDPSIGEVTGGALSLDAHAYQTLQDSSHPLRIGAATLLLVGVSWMIGHCSILFLNRVPPGRFVVTTLALAGSFILGIIVWVASTWPIAVLVFGTRGVPLWRVIPIAAFGYAPLVLSAVVIDDAFAYSVRDNPLAGNGLVAPILRSARTRYVEGRPSLLIGCIIQLRNTLQVAVSANSRYGPIYNLGLAEAIGKRLIAPGYPLGTMPPLALIGYSGGGQVAVGAAHVEHTASIVAELVSATRVHA